MADFWATGFWATGFWADGFWVADAVSEDFVDAYGPIASYPIMAPEDYLSGSSSGSSTGSDRGTQARGRGRARLWWLVFILAQWL